MKKLIASLLTVATVASMASMTAFATPATDTADLFKVAPKGSIFVDDENYVESDGTPAGTIAKREITPDSTIYIDLALLGNFEGTDNGNVIAASADLAEKFIDDDLFKVKTDKGDDDSKIIKKISVVEKNINKSAGREKAIKIELKDDMTDDEFKINPSVTFTAKEDIKNASGDEVIIKDGTKYTVELGNFYVSNNEVKGDKDWSAGDGGVVAKPTKNDDNEVTWEDENNTLVKLTFESDDDAAKYYPKMSTKWEDAHYAENFAETDAFIRNFIGNPTISSTSRPVVEFYSPFVDDDDEFTVAPEDVVIYQVVDGALVDVTEKFTIAENDDDDTVFMIKTRTLGTYIFSNGPAVAPAEEIEEPIEEPADEKANPGTGRF